MRTRLLVLAALVATPLFTTAAPASAECLAALFEGQPDICTEERCWPLEGYVADPVGFVCVH